MTHGQHALKYYTACSFITLWNEGTYKTDKDFDGNIYNPVGIGTQLWMFENLKATRYRNGKSQTLRIIMHGKH